MSKQAIQAKTAKGNERPILFSGSMVRAILEDRKTVTRRPVKGGQTPTEDAAGNDGGPRWSAIGQRHPRYGYCVFGETEAECAQELAERGVCPYGRPGDRLWVREVWVADAQVNAVAPRDLSQGEPIRYPADGGARQTGCAMITPGKSRPSIHMPRWASRILLEITTVRVERLQDISEEQALAEGIAKHPGGGHHVEDGKHYWASPIDSFAGLWSSVGGDWDANPWVWVVEFRRVQP
ncbi:hypothetical protein SAMN05216178_6290 [Pseudomonas saponiphila]|uniref:ASCH domain-containing protein n=1 Tax=Pseudomonas saponiphila TaxID=556534 RepID=A0A1H4Y0G8_9PSED|nr:hypothetical protein [Pseudomonas saponiphila]SED11456.1 hypothetical protein SAMN05216178_6290 [Pseudomonas saponiphila]